MTNLFGSLVIEIWDFIGIWCLEFEISEYLLRAFQPRTMNPAWAGNRSTYALIKALQEAGDGCNAPSISVLDQA